MALFRQELAIDLGTANTVIFKDGDVVLDEPSIIATDTKSGKLMAIDNHAQLMEEHLSDYVPVGEAITLAMQTAVPWY